MLQRPVLQLHEAELAAEQIIKAAASDGKAPVVVAVSDERGELIVLKRMDGAPYRSVQIAANKALTAARITADTNVWEERLRKQGRQAAAFGDLRFTELPGGIVLKAADGAVVGAIGISGRLPEEDHELAVVGRQALGL